MRKFLLLLVLMFGFCCVNNLAAQKPYFENIAIFKIKLEYKNDFQRNSEFLELINDYNVVEIKREFPNVKSPVSEYNKRGEKNVDLTTIYRVELPTSSDLEEFVKKLSNLKVVEYAEYLYKQELMYNPNDTYSTPSGTYNQYWLTKVKSLEAWDIHKGDTATVIAISDTGIDFNHLDLLDNIKVNYNDIVDGIDNDGDGYIDNYRGWNFAENNNNTQATTAHGVQVSGIAGAVTDNGIGLAGAGFLCKILPLKIANAAGVLVNTYQSIIYAAEHNCKVINCSWGSESYQQMAQDVVNYATINHDMLVVAACGNTNTEVYWYPASYENVLSVAGTNQNDQKWVSSATSGSTYNYKVDIAAPCIGFTVTNLGTTQYLTPSGGGTSYAAPIVSGSAGILRSYYPNYSALQIAELLKISADVIDTIEYNLQYVGKIGAGRLNLYNALTIEPTPSIVFKNYEIIYQENKVIVNGDFINYLTKAENLTISASIFNPNIRLENEIIFFDDLETYSTYHSENEIIIYLSEDIDYTQKIQLIFTYSDDNGYHATQVIEFYPKINYNTVKTDILELSVFANGRLGFSNIDHILGNGLKINNDVDILSECGIIAGTNATNVFCAPIKRESSFTPILQPILVEDENFDYHSISQFDNSATGSLLEFKVEQNIYSKSGNENKNFIILEYSLINTSNRDITNFYFGLFSDWDLINPANNSTEYDETNKFLYCKSNENQTTYAGIKLLTNQPVNNYSALMKSTDGIVNIPGGFADIEKIYMISNTNSIQQNKDVAIYTGAGPFNIKQNDTVKIAFSILVSLDYYNFMQALNAAKQVYSDMYKDTISILSKEIDLQIFPNPANDKLRIKSGELRIENIEIFDVFGKLQLTSLRAEPFLIELDIANLPSGLYFLKVYMKDGVIAKKFVKEND